MALANPKHAFARHQYRYLGLNPRIKTNTRIAATNNHTNFEVGKNHTSRASNEKIAEANAATFHHPSLCAGTGGKRLSAQAKGGVEVSGAPNLREPMP
jgi:hypothetical protein